MAVALTVMTERMGASLTIIHECLRAPHRVVGPTTRKRRIPERSNAESNVRGHECEMDPMRNSAAPR
jgi:hypothetical protein